MNERRFDPSKLERLDNPERRKALPPEQLLKLLPIQAHDAILDLGAGTGYFTWPAASMTDGTVYALDVEPKMLSILKERKEEYGLTNVEVVEGVIEDIPLPDHVVEHVIGSFVLHEVEPLSKGLTEISRTLKAGGHLFCLEWEKKDEEKGPPLDHRIHSDDMQAALTEAGFTIVSRSFPTESHYVLIAQKAGKK